MYLAKHIYNDKKTQHNSALKHNKYSGIAQLVEQRSPKPVKHILFTSIQNGLKSQNPLFIKDFRTF